MKKVPCKLAYIIREYLNDSRFLLLRLHDWIFTLIDYLDNRPSVKYWLKKERGAGRED